MAIFLPTDEALLELALLSGRERSDPAVVALFDQLVLRGQLAPFVEVEDWWELVGWPCSQVEQVVQGR